ncbi:hypothetical protein QE152_g25987 [Popillia japonica]|uniref:Uncharacterized protein n=1 Tax=Popillia japonica TaxID=7064 RepID=A0AAW1JZX0_POPJA
MDVKKKALAMMMLVEMQDIEDEMDLVVAYSLSTRGECKDMYKERENEGVFKILVQKHLIDNETKFKQYFRVTRDQFFNLLDLIKNDLHVNPTNRVQDLIKNDLHVNPTNRVQKHNHSFPVTYSTKSSSSNAVKRGC